MGSLGPLEIIIILVILLLFFGAKKLPELARGIGKSIKEFKKATNEIHDEIENAGTEKTVDKESETKTTGEEETSREKTESHYEQDDEKSRDNSNQEK